MLYCNLTCVFRRWNLLFWLFLPCGSAMGRCILSVHHLVNLKCVLVR